MTNTYYLFSKDTFKTLAQGALGAMTFGVYHQYTTNKIMDMNNQIMKQEHKQEIDKLKEQIDRLEKRKCWLF